MTPKKVKYLGEIDTVALEKDKIYDVISVEKGWYRIMTELAEDFFSPRAGEKNEETQE